MTNTKKTWTWSVNGGIEALSAMAEVRFDLMFHDFEAICDAYRRGLPVAEERFGPGIPWGQPRWASISYGHLNCLGCELRFPADSEVGVVPAFGSLREAVRSLQRAQTADFTSRGLFPRYLELWDQLKKAFPSQPVYFTGFGLEGPVTTAWLLRGHDFFMDIYDDPPLAQEYLELVTESIIAYHQTLSRVNGFPLYSPEAAGIADDGAGMLPPSLWPAFVVPYLERFYSTLTSGTRHLHVENLTTDHLPYLDQLRIGFYDPSVSPLLSPAKIRAHCQVPFHWRMNEPLYEYFTPEDARQWVLQAAAAGAERVATEVWRNNTSPRCAALVHAFIETARDVQARMAT